MPGHAAAGARAAGWADGPIVGRDELLRELRAIAGAAVEGKGCIVLLTGEAGIGKTTVVRTVTRQVAPDLEVSWGACVADESAPPFWPWRALVELEPTAPLHGTLQAIGAPRFGQLTALGDQLRAQAQPRLHVIEDLQWADVASVLLLARLAATIGDTPLLVVATVRAGEPRSPALDDAIEEVRRAAVERHLEPLDDDAVALLLRGSGTEPDDELVALVRARTGGNPLYVSELLRSMPMGEPAERRITALREAVPDRVSDLVLHRLGRLPAPVSDALITAAVLGAGGEVRVLAATHRVEVEALLDLLDQARAAHVLDAAPSGRWQFRHQLIRDAVYASAPELDRIRRHAAAVDALAADPGTPPPAVAHHALAAQPLFDADRAVALAARAAEWTLAQHAYEEAVGWFARALEAAPPETSGRWRAELLVLSGEAHRHLGDLAAARRDCLEAVELADDPGLLARAALGYADPGADLGIAFRTDDAVTTALLERALAAQSSLDSLTAVQLQARLAAELYFSDQPARARELAEDAVARARRLEDPHALGVASAVVHDSFVVGQAELTTQLEGSAQLLEWARATGSVARQLTAHRARVLDLLAAGDLAGVDAEVVAFRRLAEPLHAPGYLWWPALWSAMRALLEGRHDVAEERAVEAHGIGEGTFAGLAFLNLSFLLFFLRREQGRLAEMEQPARDAAEGFADVPAMRVALAFLLAELGRVDEVRSALAAFDDDALDRLRDRNWPASWFQLARAAALAADRGLAARLLDPARQPTERCIQVSLGTVCLGAADLARAWLLQTVGDVDGADGRYRAARDLNARLGARSWLAQAEADHAHLLLARDADGDRDEAAALLERARATARDIGLATVERPEPESTPAPSAPSAAATLQQAGAVWDVAYAGRRVQVPHARGLRDLAYLLHRPGVAVSVLELAGDGAGPVVRGAAALDERARREIRERLRELDDEEADAEAAGDGERAALARERRQELAEAVAADFGLGGRARRIGDPVERARKTVSTRIRRTIAGLGRAHPELGRHLERSIDTGTWCAYRPAEPVEWIT